MPSTGFCGHLRSHILMLKDKRINQKKKTRKLKTLPLRRYQEEKTEKKKKRITPFMLCPPAQTALTP